MIPRVLLCAVALAVVAPLASGQKRSDTPAAAEAVTAPPGLNTASPHFSSANNRTVLSWLERVGATTALKFAERTATGWTPAQTATTGAKLMINEADVSSVVLLPDGTFVAQWIEDNGAGADAYDLRLSWSKDGRTWSAPVSPHHDGTHAQHGFASLFNAGSGFGLVWLDGREEEVALRTTSFSSDGKQSADTVVDARVCECCQTSAAQTTDGVVVAYRNRDPKEVRDIFVTRLVKGKWSEPTAVHNDGWRIEGCPVNGPSIAARGRAVAVAWYTVQKNVGHAFAAFSADGGRTFGSPISVDDGGSAGRVQVVMLGDGSAAVSWVELVDGRGTIKVRKLDRSGSRSPPVTVAPAIGRWYPRLALHGSELLVAFVEQTRGTTRVRTSRLPL